MQKTLFLISLLLSSAACSQTQNEGGATAKASASATASSSAVEHDVSVENDAYVFEYSYPAVVTRYDPLRAHLDARARNQQNELALSAAEDKADAESAGYEYRKYTLSTEWKTIADLPNWLSMLGEVANYTGGAHGNYGYDDLVYDKRKAAVYNSVDLFQSLGALNKAIAPRWCAALDKERAKRRGAPVDKSDSLFGQCPGLEELTLLLGSSNGTTFDRLTLIAGPYIAGSYAEGSYEVHLGVDAAVLKVVRPEYAEDFTVSR